MILFTIQNVFLKFKPTTIVLSFAVGVLYGVTSVAVGHPFDTVKTKMQAQAGYETGGMIKTLLKTFRTQGLIGFYR